MPVTIALEYLAPERHLLIFFSSGLAILPLAAWMGRATEQLAERMGEGVGGLLNATFGNAAELIIALAALRAGLYDVVKASIAGSIVGNILLVLGAAMTMGGLRHREQTFNPQGARAQATMLTLAAIALVLPAAYQAALGEAGGAGIGAAQRLDLDRAARRLRALPRLQPGDAFRAVLGFARAEGRSQAAPSPVGRAAALLAASTAVIAWMSEILVGSIQPAAQSLGLGSVFVGVFVVAILGNAAEHATAVTVALKDRMDLALSIAIGSSVQVALFVAPVLVLVSLFIGPRPMDLAFPAGLVLIVLLAVLISGQVAADGRSDWLKGVQLLAVYVVLGLTFFFMPNLTPH